MLEKRLQQEVVCCMLSYISYPFVVKFRRKEPQDHGIF